jgi:RNA polymerase sigma-70 factor (ECF subfamily)
MNGKESDMPSGSDPKGSMAGVTRGSSVGDDFASLFMASFRQLWLIAVGVVQDASLAEDVVQESALIAMGKFHAFQRGTNFAAWMARIVQFVARNHSRLQRRRRAVAIETAESVAAVAPADAQDAPHIRLMTHGTLPADQPHFDDRVMRALRQVGEVPRMCLLLRTMEDMEYSEIAKLLKIPEGTAMSHVHRTRKFLRDQLADLAPAAGGPIREGL